MDGPTPSKARCTAVRGPGSVSGASSPSGLSVPATPSLEGGIFPSRNNVLQQIAMLAEVQRNAIATAERDRQESNRRFDRQHEMMMAILQSRARSDLQLDFELPSAGGSGAGRRGDTPVRQEHVDDNGGAASSAGDEGKEDEKDGGEGDSGATPKPKMKLAKGQEVKEKYKRLCSVSGVCCFVPSLRPGNCMYLYRFVSPSNEEMEWSDVRMKGMKGKSGIM